MKFQHHPGAAAIDTDTCEYTELSPSAWHCVAQSMLENDLSLHQAMTGCAVPR